MAIQTTYTHARARLASLLDEVTKNREVVIIQRRGSEDVAMITADELVGILETAHLLRSPSNAKRLLTALDKVRNLSGAPQTIDELRNRGRFFFLSKRRTKKPKHNMKRVAVFQPEFREDLKYWVETDRKTGLRVFQLIEAIMRDPFQGIGKPEPLKFSWVRCLVPSNYPRTSAGLCCWA